MENIDQNQFQLINTNHKFRALQGNSIARNEAIPNANAQTKHSLSTYADDEKRWTDTTLNNTHKWSNEMKVNLLKI